jgi:hypothetical protein
MQVQVAHVQNLFEELQITANASVNYDDCALTSNSKHITRANSKCN